MLFSITVTPQSKIHTTYIHTYSHTQSDVNIHNSDVKNNIVRHQHHHGDENTKTGIIIRGRKKRHVLRVRVLQRSNDPISLHFNRSTRLDCTHRHHLHRSHCQRYLQGGSRLLLLAKTQAQSVISCQYGKIRKVEKEKK